jgi:hypothetical protein
MAISDTNIRKVIYDRLFLNLETANEDLLAAIAKLTSRNYEIFIESLKTMMTDLRWAWTFKMPIVVRYIPLDVRIVGLIDMGEQPIKWKPEGYEDLIIEKVFVFKMVPNYTFVKLDQNWSKSIPKHTVIGFTNENDMSSWKLKYDGD